MSLKKLYEKFDKEYCKVLAEYYDLHKQLDRFRGVDLTEEIVEQANPIIIAIQEKFIELEPCLEWAIHRYQTAVRIRLEYEQFIDHIKKGGAVVDDKKPEAFA
jgi:hypothetical protein